jgi:hypothetical protein
MNSGIVSIVEINALSNADLAFEGLVTRSPLQKKISAVTSAAVVEVPKTQGVYLWGRYEKNNLWTNIYFGKAGFGKTASLQARILEELRDERIFAYLDVDTSTEKIAERKAKLLAHCKEQANPRMWETYSKHMHRHFHKAGTTHIVWVSAPNIHNDEVREIESDLIESLNPRANIMRPAPPTTEGMQANTKDVFYALRTQIHQSRPQPSLKTKRVKPD